MKKIRRINFICYVFVTYLLSSLYGILFRLEVPRILKIENLTNLSILFLVLLITGYLITNFFKSLKEVFESGAKKIFYVLVIVYGVNINNVALIYAISICLIGAYAVLFLKNRQIKKQKKVDESENEPELYPSRRNLMEVLNHALREYSLIALDGTWGSGKTTFMDIAMKKNEKDYYYIPIDIMLFKDKNSLKREFLNHLKEIFKKNGVLQGTLIEFDHCLNGVSNDLFKVFYKIFISKSNTLKEINKNMKKDIKKLDKIIVVGVDNLERIYGESEPEWKQMLGFIHELQELGVKIVVMANLGEMLTTKKETGEKDLSNYEYFDKFYEFKLSVDKLDISEENYIKEILEEIPEINDRFKEWYITEEKELYSIISNLYVEKQKELKNEVNKYNETEKKVDQSMGREKSVKGINEKINSLKEEIEQLERYHRKRSNPRSVEKIVKDIKVKGKITNIFMDTIDDEMYKKTTFRVSVFWLFYFNLLNGYEKKGITNEKNVINSIFSRISPDNRAINRLLFYEAKDDIVKTEIESIKKEEITMSNINQKIKDLKRYEERLDPDLNKNTTKEACKIIEEKLIELENSDKGKIYKVIKENEENICRLNYLTYPNELGIFKNIKYKFNLDAILKVYNKEIEKIESIVLNNIDKDQGYTHETMPLELVGVNMNIDRVKKILFMYYKKTINPTLSPNELYKMTKYSTPTEINLDIGILIEELKEKLNIREKHVFLEKSVEDIIFKRILVLLDILEKNEVKENNDEKKNELDNWRNLNKNEKIEYLNKEMNEFRFGLKPVFKLNKMYIKSKEFKGKLINIIGNEKDEGILLKLDNLLKTMSVRVFNEKIEELFNFDKEELVKVINTELNIDKYNYIYEENMKKLVEIGIENEGSKFVFKKSQEKLETTLIKENEIEKEKINDNVNQIL